MNDSPPTSRDGQLRWAVTSLRCLAMGLFLSCLAGCGDPIYDAVPRMPPAKEIVLTSPADVSRYEWPLTRDGYFVAKPPQMAYITSFDGKLSCPDPVTAKLVPWSGEGLDPEMLEFLNQAYKPASIELDVTLTLTESQFAGAQAFDVSADGSRLVVIDGSGLAFYLTEDGSLIERMSLPGAIASARPAVSAVRFCGATKDLLVASSEQIFRISGQDGSISGESKSCGEPIAQWVVTDNDQAMLIRGESGRLFGGDPQLEYFSAYNPGKDLTFHTASLSPDGTRIGVVINGVPRTYIQESFQIVDEVDYNEVKLDPDVSIACGISSDAWVDGDGVFYTAPNNAGGRDTGVYHMLWKPLQVSMASTEPNVNHYLTVGRRLVDGKEQLVMFDFGALGRNNSLPQRLDERPIRYAHSLTGHRVAILDRRGLRICRRDEYRTEGPALWSRKIYNWVDAGKFTEIEQLLSIIHSQTRLGFGMTAESLRSFVIREMAARWMHLTENDPDGEWLAGLEAWRKQGSQLAILASGIRHYRVAWNARGSGTMDTVTQQGYETYSKHLNLAQQELDRVIEMKNPPVAAIETRISTGLELGNSLEEVDPWCRLATALYPTEIDPHDAIAFKLLPQWFGEYGDALSYALSVSKMFEGAEGDYKYVRLTCYLVNQLHFNNAVQWRSYDSNRIRRGLDELIRRRAYTGDELWMLWTQFTQRTRDNESADRVLTYLMAHRAAPPWLMTHGEFAALGSTVHQRAEYLRSQ